MGKYRILCVKEDVTRRAQLSPADWDRLKVEVGDAVLSLCATRPVSLNVSDILEKGAKYCQSVDAHEHQTSATVDRNGGAVQLVAQMHSDWQHVFLWSAGSMKLIADLSDSELTLARSLLQKEELARSKRAGKSPA